MYTRRVRARRSRWLTWRSAPSGSAARGERRRSTTPACRADRIRESYRYHHPHAALSRRRRDRRRLLRRLDRLAPAPGRAHRSAHRRFRGRPFASELGRRVAHHPDGLRRPDALFALGARFAAAVEGSPRRRRPVGPLSRDRRAVAGPRRRPARRRHRPDARPTRRRDGIARPRGSEVSISRARFHRHHARHLRARQWSPSGSSGRQRGGGPGAAPRRRLPCGFGRATGPLLARRRPEPR